MTIQAIKAAPVVLHPREQLRQMRAKVAEAAQRLIDLLDQIDGDPDFEDGADAEPSLGSLSHIHQGMWSGDAWGSDLGVTDDLEEACEDEGAQCDDEGHQETDAEIVAAFAIDQTGVKWALGEPTAAS